MVAAVVAVAVDVVESSPIWSGSLNSGCTRDTCASFIIGTDCARGASAGGGESNEVNVRLLQREREKEKKKGESEDEKEQTAHSSMSDKSIKNDSLLLSTSLSHPLRRCALTHEWSVCLQSSSMYHLSHVLIGLRLREYYLQATGKRSLRTAERQNEV